MTDRVLSVVILLLFTSSLSWAQQAPHQVFQSNPIVPVNLLSQNLGQEWNAANPVEFTLLLERSTTPSNSSFAPVWMSMTDLNLNYDATRINLGSYFSLNVPITRSGQYLFELTFDTLKVTYLDGENRTLLQEASVNRQLQNATAWQQALRNGQFASTRLESTSFFLTSYEEVGGLFTYSVRFSGDETFTQPAPEDDNVIDDNDDDGSPNLTEITNSLGLPQGDGTNGHAYFDSETGFYCGLLWDRSPEVQAINNQCVSRGCGYLVDPATGRASNPYFRTWLDDFHTEDMSGRLGQGHVSWHATEVAQWLRVDNAAREADPNISGIRAGWLQSNMDNESISWINGFYTMHKSMFKNVFRSFLSKDNGSCFYLRHNMFKFNDGERFDPPAQLTRAQVMAVEDSGDTTAQDASFTLATSEAQYLRTATTKTLAEFILYMGRTFHGYLHNSLFMTSTSTQTPHPTQLISNIETSTEAFRFWQDIHGYVDYFIGFWLRANDLVEISDSCHDPTRAGLFQDTDRPGCTTWTEHTNGQNPRTMMPGMPMIMAKANVPAVNKTVSQTIVSGGTPEHQTVVTTPGKTSGTQTTVLIPAPAMVAAPPAMAPSAPAFNPFGGGFPSVQEQVDFWNKNP